MGAAQVIAPGRAVAVDSSERMLTRLDAKIRQFGIGNIDVPAMPEGQLTFRRDYFDRDGGAWLPSAR